MTFEAILPIKTVSESNKTNEHWTLKQKRHKLQKYIVYNTLDLKEIKLPCLVKLTRLAPKKLDDDNLVSSFKWIRDAVAEKLIPGLQTGIADGDPRIQWNYAQERGKPKTYEVKIQIVY